MRLDFRILWIDDQQKHVNSFAEGLRYKLKDLGFDLEVIRVEKLEDINEKITEHVHHDGIDLVLVDYDLGVGTGDGGDQAILAVRAKFPYKEIIFYSAADTEKLRTIAYTAKVDGIVFSTRLSLVNDATLVIENLLRKVLDIDHMRGVVMSATSDIDFLVEHTLRAMYDRLNEPEQVKFREVIAEQLQKKLSEWNDDLKKALEKSSIEAILKAKHLFSAADRLNSLILQLDAWKNTSSSYQDKVIEYRKDVVPTRNKLAHVILRRENGSSELIGGENFTADNLAQLRVALLEHRENFQTIAVLVDVKF